MAHIWPYMVHIWAIYGHIWSIYGHICPYMAIHDLYMTIYGPYMAIKLAIYGCMMRARSCSAPPPKVWSLVEIHSMRSFISFHFLCFPCVLYCFCKVSPRPFTQLFHSFTQLFRRVTQSFKGITESFVFPCFASVLLGKSKKCPDPG